MRRQRLVYQVGEALRQELPTERLYILSLGSQSGNRHVHWHVAPRVREAAPHTNAAAYSDAVPEYAALGRDELREAARAALAVTSGRG